jgi:hypothetical protein
MVKEIQRPGLVKGLLVDYLGVQYSVHYWDNGSRRSEWMTEPELEAR